MFDPAPIIATTLDLLAHPEELRGEPGTHCGPCAGSGWMHNPNLGRRERCRICDGRGIQKSQGWRESADAADAVQPRGDGTCSAAGAALRPVTPSGYRVASPAHRRRRIALRRGVYQCRTAALLLCVVMAGAFAADRPVAGVLASALVFMLLRCAAEARAEL